MALTRFYVTTAETVYETYSVLAHDEADARSLVSNGDTRANLGGRYFR